jgi:hypothetical protein
MARCVPCFEVLVARDTCEEKEGWMERAVFLATAAFLAMLILVPMAMGQEETTLPSSPPPCATTMVNGSVVCPGAAAGGGGNMGTTVIGDGIPAGSPSPLEDTGGPALLLPAAALLLGSGILTYAILRRG